jgi:hypothetical protein
MLGQHGCCLGCKVLIRPKPQQGEGVSGSAVQRAQAAVVVILPPHPIVTTTRAARQPRLARRLHPPRLPRPLVHCERCQQRSGCPPTDGVRRVGNVAPNEGAQIVRECCVGASRQATSSGPSPRAGAIPGGNAHPPTRPARHARARVCATRRRRDRVRFLRGRFGEERRVPRSLLPHRHRALSPAAHCGTHPTSWGGQSAP